MNMERRLLGLKTIRNKASNQIDEEVDKTAVPGTFDLRNVLQLFIDALNGRTFS